MNDPRPRIGESSAPDQPVHRKHLWWTLFWVWVVCTAASWVVYLGYVAPASDHMERARAGWLRDVSRLNQRRHVSKKSLDSSGANAEIQADEKRILKNLKEIAQPRGKQNAAGSVRGYLLESLTAAEFQPKQQTFHGGVNIIWERPGTDADAGVYLIGAHYDVVSQSPGADDNASGVVGVIELAHIFSQIATRSTLRFVLFDGEERGLLGSKYFVRTPSQTANVRGVFILEMIGFTCSKKGCQKYPSSMDGLDVPDTGQFVAAVGNRERVDLLESLLSARRGIDPQVIALPIPRQGQFHPHTRRSDHASFWDHKIGAVMLTDTGDFRNPNYHGKTDTVDTLDLVFLRGVIEVVGRAVLSLANQTHKGLPETP